MIQVTSDELTIVEFLKTGNLKQLHLGMKFDDALDYLGIPDYQRSVGDYKAAVRMAIWHDALEEIWTHYGPLAVIFEPRQEALVGIQINPARLSRQVPPSLGDTWLAVIDNIRSSSAFKRFLDKYQIECTETLYDMIDTLEISIESSGIEANFNLENGEDKLVELLLYQDYEGSEGPTVKA